MELRDARVMAVLPAEDLERARGFYGGTLGLRAPADWPVPDDGAVYACADGTMLFLYRRSDGREAPYTVAGWLVDDIEQVVHDLREKGVKFEQYNRPGMQTNALGIAPTGGARTAWFKDTEGNLLSLVEMFPGD